MAQLLSLRLLEIKFIRMVITQILDLSVGISSLAATKLVQF